MTIILHYFLLVVVYLLFGSLGFFVHYFKTDIVYLLTIIFIAVGISSIIYDMIESKQYDIEPFYKKIYQNTDYILLSFLNYIRYLLFMIAVSFKDLGVVTATYLSFPIFVMLFGLSIINYKPRMNEIIGVLVAFVGIIIINFKSIMIIIHGKFNKIAIFSFLFPLLSALIISYIIISSKKYNELSANQYIEAIFIPVIPFVILLCLFRNTKTIKKILHFICIPYIKTNTGNIIKILLYGIIIFYSSNLVLYSFIKKYTAVLASILSYFSIIAGFILKKYYFKNHIKYHEIIGSLIILSGIILVSNHTFESNKIQ